jgi:GNAT superfamily N-acetyltransferase
VQLERFDPARDQAALGLCHELYLAGLPIDDPRMPAMSRRGFTAWLALGWTEDHPETWLACDAAGRACGWYSITFSERENTHLAYLAALVGPEYRRRGIGTALVRHAAAHAHVRGRTQLAAESRQGSPAESFCRALGAAEGLTEAVRALRISDIPDGHLPVLRSRAQAAAQGYTLVSWEGPVPEHHLADVVSLNHAMNDAPIEERREGQVWDVARLRASQARVAAAGLRYYTVAARCQRTGELAGITQLGVDPFTPHWGFQEMTAVARQHRGHRLGLLVKAAMLELLADHEPQLDQIVTGNADGNEHMIAINAELGFRVIDHWLSWELPVASVLAPQAATRP